MIVMINEQYKYSGLTSKITGCAITVHKTLGNGFTHFIDLIVIVNVSHFRK